jgi:3-hydroxyacyl-[acyl-carrier-protein] dehydratase
LTTPRLRQDGWRAEFPEGISADAACLDGHFPGDPIVPGAVLLALAARELANEGLKVAKLRRMKFHQPLSPDRALAISFEIAGVRARVTWLDGEDVLARAQLTLSTNDH